MSGIPPRPPFNAAVITRDKPMQLVHNMQGYTTEVFFGPERPSEIGLRLVLMARETGGGWAPIHLYFPPDGADALLATVKDLWDGDAA